MTRSVSLRLNERDLDLLDALADYRFLTALQAATVMFRTPGSITARLRSLVAAGLVVPVFMPVRPTDRSHVTVYALGAKGGRLIAPRHGGIRPRHLTAREARSGLFLEHTLKRNDFRLALERLSERDPRFSLLSWSQVPDQVRASAMITLGGRREFRVPMVPDGVAVVRMNGSCEVLAIEIDCGTVPVERMWRRYRGYWKWWRMGGPTKRYGAVPYRVLTLAPDVRRLAALQKAAARAPEKGHRGSKLFWFAPLAVASIDSPHALLDTVWTAATLPETPARALFT